MVTMWTGRMGEGGVSAVDTTMKSASTPIGKLLAPTKALVYGHKAWRGDTRFRRYAPVDDATYRRRYLERLRAHFKAQPDLFRELLERETVTLTCYCGKDNPYCHRFILVSYVLPRCAAYFDIPYHYAGER